jgi:hypothetical protein
MESKEGQPEKRGSEEEIDEFSAIFLQDCLKSLGDIAMAGFNDYCADMAENIIPRISDVDYLISVIEQEDKKRGMMDYIHTPVVLKLRGKEVYARNPALVDRLAEGCADPVSRMYAINLTADVSVLEKCTAIDCRKDILYGQLLKEEAQERLKELKRQ